MQESFNAVGGILLQVERGQGPEKWQSEKRGGQPGDCAPAGARGVGQERWAEEYKREAHGKCQIDPEQSGVAIDPQHRAQAGKTARSRELNRPVEIVGQTHGVLDERKRKDASARGSAEQQSGGAAVSNPKIGDADDRTHEERQSGVLLDEERNDQDDATGEGRKRGKFADSRRRSSKVQQSIKRVQSES